MKPDHLIKLIRDRVPYLKDYKVDTEGHQDLITIFFTKENTFEDVEAYLPIKDEDSGYLHFDSVTLSSKLLINLFDAGEEEEKHILLKLENDIPEMKKGNEMNFGVLQKQLKLEEIFQNTFGYEANISDLTEEEINSSNRLDNVINEINKILYQLDEFTENYMGVRFP